MDIAAHLSLVKNLLLVFLVDGTDIRAFKLALWVFISPCRRHTVSFISRAALGRVLAGQILFNILIVFTIFIGWIPWKSLVFFIVFISFKIIEFLIASTFVLNGFQFIIGLNSFWFFLDAFVWIVLDHISKEFVFVIVSRLIIDTSVEVFVSTIIDELILIVDKIFLVSNKSYDNMFIWVLSYLLKPLFQIEKGLLISYIVNQKGSNCKPVVDGSDAQELLCSWSVPYLGSNSLVAIRKVDGLEIKFNSVSGFWLFYELILSDSHQ